MWSDLLKDENIVFTNNVVKKVEENINKDDGLKAEDYFKDVDEEFDNIYYDIVAKIVFDYKDYLNHNSTLDFNKTYDFIKKYSKNYKKTKRKIEKYNDKFKEDFEKAIHELDEENEI